MTNQDKPIHTEGSDPGGTTSEILASSSFREMRAVFIGAILIVLAVNIAMILYLPKSTTNLGYWIIGKKWQMLLRLPAPIDWLILGDSSGNQGLMPKILEERLGGRSVNLCTIADMTVLNDAWMLDTYLKSKGTLRAVLVVHVYDVWNRDFDARMMARIPMAIEGVRQLKPPVRLTPYKILRGFLDRYLPLYYQHETVASLIKFPLSHPQHELLWEEDGFMSAVAAKPSAVEGDARNHLTFVRETQFRLSESNRTALEYLADAAERHSFDLFIANSPLYEGLIRDAAFVRYYSDMERAIGRVIAGRRNVHYILRAPMTFAKEQLQNADHVTRSAAVEYTTRVVAEIEASQQQGSR